MINRSENFKFFLQDIKILIQKLLFHLRTHEKVSLKTWLFEHETDSHNELVKTKLVSHKIIWSFTFDLSNFVTKSFVKYNKKLGFGRKWYECFLQSVALFPKIGTFKAIFPSYDTFVLCSVAKIMLKIPKTLWKLQDH